MKNRHFLITLLTLLPALSTAVVAEPTIIVSYQDAISKPPPEDPDGAHLQAAMERAAREWVSYFPDTTETIHINYRYRNETDILPDGDKDEDRLAVMGRCVIGCDFYVRFDTLDGKGDPIPWFFDSTPDDDSEFEMEQTFAFEGDPSWFANRHDLMEISYSGDAAFTWAEDGGLPAAVTGIDLISTAFHEIGHALLSPAKSGVAARGHFLADGGYMSRFIGGGGWDLQILAASKKSGPFSSGVDKSHFAADSLMDPGDSEGERFLPAAPEILTIATARGWGDVNLPRAEMLSTPVATGDYDWGDWRVWFSVDPGPNPAIRDETLTSSAVMTGVHDLRSLTLTHDGPVDVPDNRISLTIEGSVAVKGPILVEVPMLDATTSKDGRTELFLETGSLSTFERLEIANALVQAYPLARMIASSASGGSPRIEIRENGLLALGDGSVLRNFTGEAELTAGSLSLAGAEASCRFLRLDQDSAVSGFGSIDSVYELTNDGRIEAANGNLLIATTDGGLLDLDGENLSENGVIDASVGSIRFEGVIADEFDGTMTVGQQVSFDREWTLGMSGLLEFILDDARVQGPEMSVASYSRIDCPVEAAIRAQVTFETLANVSVDGELKLQRRTVYEGGQFYGLGVITQIGNAIVEDTTRIATAGYAMDGDHFNDTTFVPGSSTVRVRPAAELVVYGEIGVAPADGYDGALTLAENAKVRFYQPLQLDPSGSISIGDGAKVECQGGLHNDGLIQGSGTLEVYGGMPTGSGTIAPTIDVAVH